MGPETCSGKSGDHFEAKGAFEVRFCFAVSLTDGTVQHTTSSLGHLLGFPKDSWVGHNILDFIHPDDQQNFSSHVTENLKFEMDGGSKRSFSIRFCRYKGSNQMVFSQQTHRNNYKLFKLSTFLQGLVRQFKLELIE